MEKKIIYRVECRLVNSGRSAIAYFESKEDAQNSLMIFKKRHGYDAVVSLMNIFLESDVVDFTDRI